MTKLTAKSEKSSVPQTRPATGGALAEEQARALLPKLVALEKVRNELGAENISVPGIVVAGSQSAGKSSVLERCGCGLCCELNSVVVAFPIV